ncbi:LytTR family DNA-binding domain-containing protein [Rhodocytophaga aerolata]|uniref:LytTR family DNA-binding domain-containing protein n=1 Tax=Rhodocytophaga aerolata TaxID=455078 RepID=A0ABT8R6T7_9BACT|nr:LytTR family DNA-binding domain-containing protein [Rhodocytophaga aerolata]MDO1447816.1 LytTR family DNA-binding domain-containing protein [Rhodocytophaga aerolata]
MLHVFPQKISYQHVWQKIKRVRHLSAASSQPSAGSASTFSYNDSWLRIVGSLAATHFIEVLGREESLFYLLLQKFYYIDVISGFFIAFIVWEMIARATQYLDARVPWEKHPVKRIGLQVLVAVFIPSVVLHMLTYLQFTYILGQQMSVTSWYIYELPVCILLIILINTYYLTYYFFRQYHLLKQQGVFLASANATSLMQPLIETPVVKRKRQVFIINKGHRNIPLSVEEIAYIYKKEEYCYLRTFTGETHLIDESLEDIFSQLDQGQFFRANRQTIVSFHACKYYSTLDYGKLEVALLPEADEAVVVSQKRAPLFKEWVSR